VVVGAICSQNAALPNGMRVDSCGTIPIEHNKSGVNTQFEKMKNAQKWPFLTTILALSRWVLCVMQIRAHIRVALIITHILVITCVGFGCKAETQSKSGVNTQFEKRLFSQYLRGYCISSKTTKREVVGNYLRASLVPRFPRECPRPKQENRPAEKKSAEA